MRAISWSDSTMCDRMYHAGYSWSRHVMRLKTPRYQANMRKSFLSPLLKVCSLLFLFHNHPCLPPLHTTHHILSPTTLTHLASRVLIPPCSLHARNCEFLNCSQIAQICLDVNVVDVTNMLVSFIIIPELFYIKHVVHAWWVWILLASHPTNKFYMLIQITYSTATAENSMPTRQARKRWRSAFSDRYEKYCIWVSYFG